MSTTTVAQIISLFERNDTDIDYTWFLSFPRDTPAEAVWRGSRGPNWMMQLAPLCGVHGSVYAQIAADVVERFALPNAGRHTEYVKESLRVSRAHIDDALCKRDLQRIIDGWSTYVVSPEDSAGEAAKHLAESALIWRPKINLSTVPTQDDIFAAWEHGAHFSSWFARGAVRATVATRKDSDFAQHVRQFGVDLVRSRIPWESIERGLSE